MFKEIICPLCGKKFTKDKTFFICKNCRETFPYQDNLVSLWKSKFETDKKSQKILKEELHFTKKLSTSLKKGKNKSKKIVAEAEEFLSRDQESTYAAQKIDEKAFQDLKSLLPYDLSNLKILDIGAGFGKEAECLQRWGAADLVLTDLSLDFLRLAKKRVKARYFFQANAEYLPLASNSFDLAIFGSTLHHIPNPLKALKEACRVAGMIAAFAEPSDMYQINWLLEKTGWNTEYGNLKTHRFNPDKLQRYLKDLGFTAKIKTDFIWFPLKQLKLLSDKKWFVDGYFTLLKVLDKLAGHYGHNLTFFAKRNV